MCKLKKDTCYTPGNFSELFSTQKYHQFDSSHTSEWPFVQKLCFFPYSHFFFGTPCIILTLKTENKVFLTKNCSSVRNNIMHILDGGLDWVILLHLSGGLVLRFYLNTFEDQTEIVSTHAVSDTNLINMQTTCCKLFDCLITHTTVPLCWAVKVWWLTVTSD